MLSHFPRPVSGVFCRSHDAKSRRKRGEKSRAHVRCWQVQKKWSGEKRGSTPREREIERQREREREAEGEEESENARKVFEAIHEWFARITQIYRGCRRRKVQQLTCRNLRTAAMWEVRFTSEREWCNPRQLDVLKKCQKNNNNKKPYMILFS